MDATMILALNAGSSTVKYALFSSSGRDVEELCADTVEYGDGEQIPACVREILKRVEGTTEGKPIAAIGHRIVHGGEVFTKPVQIDATVLTELEQLIPYAPEHLPQEIMCIEACRKHVPDVPQVGCFDTAFHATMPKKAELIALPEALRAKGIRRYGFHGISYAYLLEELQKVDPEAIQKRIVLAHLGNGASMAAVKHGRCIDTTMGFTPASGLIMGTRIGDIDPGVAWYLVKQAGMSIDEMYECMHAESGLLGLSGSTADMRMLLEREESDPKAAQAIDLFCYRVQCMIGAYAAALEGIDVLVFSGGIGEHAAKIRARVCEPLGHLGISLSVTENANHAPVISSSKSAVAVRVMHTDEQRMIALWTAHVLDSSA